MWVYWRERKLTLDGLIRALPFPEESLPVVIFVITYLAFFILSSSSIIKIKTIDDRFLSPIYAPMMIIFFMLADRLAGWSKRFTAETQRAQRFSKENIGYVVSWGVVGGVVDLSGGSVCGSGAINV